MSIRSFGFLDLLDATPATPAIPATPAVPVSLTLSLSRKQHLFLLVHPTPQSLTEPNERQWCVVNALAAQDPFPEISDEGRIRIWLKPENQGLLHQLVEAGVVRA